VVHSGTYLEKRRRVTKSFNDSRLLWPGFHITPLEQKTEALVLGLVLCCSALLFCFIACIYIVKIEEDKRNAYRILQESQEERVH
jgi:hypothetical protein